MNESFFSWCWCWNRSRTFGSIVILKTLSAVWIYLLRCWSDFHLRLSLSGMKWKQQLSWRMAEYESILYAKQKPVESLYETMNQRIAQHLHNQKVQLIGGHDTPSSSVNVNSTQKYCSYFALCIHFLVLSKLMFAKEHFIVHKYEERKNVNKQIQRNLKSNFVNDAMMWKYEIENKRKI